MFLIQRDHLVQDLPPATSDPALRQPFCQGACTPVRFGSHPAAGNKALTSASQTPCRDTRVELTYVLQFVE
jgi:hypothetical protein